MTAEKQTDRLATFILEHPEFGEPDGSYEDCGAGDSAIRIIARLQRENAALRERLLALTEFSAEIHPLVHENGRVQCGPWNVEIKRSRALLDSVGEERTND